MTKPRNRDGLPHVVVVGGGFAGLAAVKTLSKLKPPVRVTLLEQHNYHLFQPLLYQLATGLVQPADIAHPVRGIVRRYKRTSVRMATVTGVDLDARQVLVEEGRSYGYDYLDPGRRGDHGHLRDPRGGGAQLPPEDDARRPAAPRPPAAAVRAGRERPGGRRPGGVDGGGGGWGTDRGGDGRRPARAVQARAGPRLPRHRHHPGPGGAAGGHRPPAGPVPPLLAQARRRDPAQAGGGGPAGPGVGAGHPRRGQAQGRDGDPDQDAGLGGRGAGQPAGRRAGAGADPRRPDPGRRRPGRARPARGAGRRGPGRGGRRQGRAPAAGGPAGHPGGQACRPAGPAQPGRHPQDRVRVQGPGDHGHHRPQRGGDRAAQRGAVQGRPGLVHVAGAAPGLHRGVPQPDQCAGQLDLELPDL